MHRSYDQSPKVIDCIAPVHYVRGVQLRDHPIIRSYHGRSNWPPIWLPVLGTPDQSIAGELGILRNVQYRIGYPQRVHLVIEHADETFVGTLLFDDGSFCFRLAMFLKMYIGRAIEEIGGLDLSFML